MINPSKKTIRRVALVASFLTIGFGAPAFADSAAVVDGCNAGGDCASLVRSEVAGKSDSEIADLVLALSDAAGHPGSGCRSLASGIDAAADGVSDSEQSQRIRRIAGGLCTTVVTTASIKSDEPDRELRSASPN